MPPAARGPGRHRPTRTGRTAWINGISAPRRARGAAERAIPMIIEKKRLKRGRRCGGRALCARRWFAGPSSGWSGFLAPSGC